MKKLICAVSVVALMMGTMPASLFSAEDNTITLLRPIRSMTYEATQEQVEEMKAREDLQYYTEKPTVARGQTVIAISPALGGGFLVGSSAGIAAALNATAITVGLTAAAAAGATVIGASVAAAAAAAVVVSTITTTTTHD